MPSSALPPLSHIPEAPFIPPLLPSRCPVPPSRAISRPPWHQVLALAAALSHPVPPSRAPTPPICVSTAAFTHPGLPSPCTIEPHACSLVTHCPLASTDALSRSWPLSWEHCCAPQSPLLVISGPTPPSHTSWDEEWAGKWQVLIHL
ncbi:hypothetical protein DENSPDRAFT_886975 [Dentipellis sp. KUC8613]|nr:hypothetical protein DENSPDRAFT_886975 [Dentipellis sp. KUC8613]